MKIAGRTRNLGIAEEGGNNLHKSLQNRVCEQCFSKGEKRWLVFAFGKSDIIELFPPAPSV